MKPTAIQLEVGKKKRGKTTIPVPFQDLLEDFENNILGHMARSDDHPNYEVYIHDLVKEV